MKSAPHLRLLLAVAALILWASTPWITAETFDDKSGDATPSSAA